MPDDRDDRSPSWFRSRGGRRFGLEFGLIIGIKLLLLMMIWALFIRPMPRAETTPEALEQHFSAPVTPEQTK